jgi:WD40 repeat protein
VAVAFAGGGRRLISGSEDGTVKLWDATIDPEVFRLPCFGQASLDMSPTGETAVITAGSRITALNTASAQVLQTFEINDPAVLALSPDDRVLAVQPRNDTVQVWDLVTGRRRHAFAAVGHRGAALDADGARLATGDVQKPLTVWDTASGRKLAEFASDNFIAVALTSDGQTVAAAGGPVSVWSVEKQQLLWSKEDPDRFNHVAFSPDGSRLASTGRGLVRIWDVATGRELLTLIGHRQGVTGVAWSPDGKRLVSNGVDDTVRLWDLATGQELLQFRHTQEFTSRVAFSRDGSRIVLAAHNHIVLWETRLPDDEQREGRAGVLRVADLFEKHLLTDEVVARIRDDGGLTEARRQAMLRVARGWGLDGERLNGAAWEIVRRPGGDPARYRLALRYAEAVAAAVGLVPSEDESLNTLGVTQYRTGNFAEAVTTLTRVQAMRKGQSQDASSCACLAMAHYRLGDMATARTYLEQLRALFRDGGHADDADAQGFLCEAEAVLGGR